MSLCLGQGERTMASFMNENLLLECDAGRLPQLWIAVVLRLRVA
jgi:hypothetical protein